MEKKDIITWISVFFLTAVFTLVCAALFLSGNKSEWLTARKIKIGAAILSLTAVMAGCRPPEVTCYDTAAVDYFVLDSISGDTITINDPVTGKITGTIHSRTITSFSYRITAAEDSLVRAGNIEPLDGAMDEGTEQFGISVAGIPHGDYNLGLYFGSAADYSGSSNAVTECTLSISGK